LNAAVARGELNLGFAVPNPTCVVSPPSHSSTGQVHFTLALTTAALVALMTLVAHPVWLAQHPGYAPDIEEAAR
jgi:hypothetical protein